MATNIRWICSQSASCFHAAAAIAADRVLADSALWDALEPTARELGRWVAAAEIPAETFWRLLPGFAAGIENNLQLAEVVLRKTLGGARAGSLAPRLADLFFELEKEFRQAKPHVVAELELRGRPLREQWEARGNGMLFHIGELTDTALIADSAEVILVHPALGGGGQAHLHLNSARLEAVLANPVAELPEAARLGWLVSQLHCDLPIHGEMVNTHRLPAVAELALLPPALEAACRVELTKASDELLPLAVEHWLAGPPDSTERVEAVRSWWQTYQLDRPPWRVALAALDRMLP